MEKRRDSSLSRYAWGWGVPASSLIPNDREMMPSSPVALRGYAQFHSGSRLGTAIGRDLEGINGDRCGNVVL